MAGCETRPILLADAGGRAPHATTVRGDRAAAYDTVGAGGIAAPLLLPVERPGPEVGVVSEKSAVSAAVPSLEGLRMAQTGFRGAAGEGSGGKERTGFHRGRNASAKLEIPAKLYHGRGAQRPPMTDPFAAMKAAQKHGWAYFAPVETFTIAPAGQLVRRAGVHAGQHVLDVACGTGVVSVTAARRGARVSGLDFAPDLLARARQNSELAGLDIEWIEGDAEQLPFPDATFDAVLSQFGHIFAPRVEVTLSEMLRVLKPGGTIASRRGRRNSTPARFLMWPAGTCRRHHRECRRPRSGVIRTSSASVLVPP